MFIFQLTLRVREAYNNIHKERRNGRIRKSNFKFRTSDKREGHQQDTAFL